MIVHDLKTLEEAIQMLSREGSVRYIDEFSHRTITSPEQLERVSLQMLERDDVAVVAPSLQEIESHYSARLAVRKRRAQEERARVRQWVSEHPELAEATAEEIPAIARRIRKEEARRD